MERRGSRNPRPPRKNPGEVDLLPQYDGEPAKLRPEEIPSFWNLLLYHVLFDLVVIGEMGG